MLESSCKTQRLGTEEHRAIVSLSWGIWIAHYAFSLCQGGLESQNSKRSSEETGLKHFISEIFMPKRKKKKESSTVFQRSEMEEWNRERNFPEAEIGVDICS